MAGNETGTAAGGDAPELDEARALLREREETARRLRHDLRGTLSPIMLTADRLMTHADPSVQRAAKLIALCVERATGLLQTPPAADEAGAGKAPASGERQGR